MSSLFLQTKSVHQYVALLLERVAIIDQNVFLDDIVNYITNLLQPMFPANQVNKKQNRTQSRVRN